jgi:hypothetical protein
MNMIQKIRLANTIEKQYYKYIVNRGVFIKEIFNEVFYSVLTNSWF